MMKATVLSLMAALMLGFSQDTSAAGTPNPAKEPIDQKVAPDGSEVDKSQPGPIAVPFGGTSEESEKSGPKSSVKNAIGTSGTVESVTAKRLRVIDVRKQVRDYRITKHTVITDADGTSGIQLKKGDSVLVLFEEKTLNLQKVQLLRDPR